MPTPDPVDAYFKSIPIDNPTTPLQHAAVANPQFWGRAEAIADHPPDTFFNAGEPTGSTPASPTGQATDPVGLDFNSPARPSIGDLPLMKRLEAWHAGKDDARNVGFWGRTAAATKVALAAGLDASTDNVDRLLNATRRPGDPLATPPALGQSMFGVTDHDKTLAEHAGSIESFLAGTATLPTAFLDPVAFGSGMVTKGAGAAFIEGTPLAGVLTGIEAKAGPHAAATVGHILAGSGDVGAFSALHAAASYPDWETNPTEGIKKTGEALLSGLQTGAVFGAGRAGLELRQLLVRGGSDAFDSGVKPEAGGPSMGPQFAFSDSPDSLKAPFNLYGPGQAPASGSGQFMHTYSGKPNLLDLQSPEAASMLEKLRAENPDKPVLHDALASEAKHLGYEGLTTDTHAELFEHPDPSQLTVKDLGTGDVRRDVVANGADPVTVGRAFKEQSRQFLTDRFDAPTAEVVLGLEQLAAGPWAKANGQPVDSYWSSRQFVSSLEARSGDLLQSLTNGIRNDKTPSPVSAEGSDQARVPKADGSTASASPVVSGRGERASPDDGTAVPTGQSTTGRTSSEGGSSAGDGSSHPAIATAEFQKWFSGSDVTVVAGSPKIMYHGTRSGNEFTTFDTANSDLGSHFGDAVGGSERSLEGSKAGVSSDRSRVLPVWLSIKNPIKLKDPGTTWDLSQVVPQLQKKGIRGLRVSDLEDQALSLQKSGLTRTQAHNQILTGILKANGFDGARYVNTVENAGHESWIALDSSQIKSVFNTGDFNSANPDILHQTTPEGIAGMFRWVADKQQALIGILESGNRSTVVHELAHFYRQSILSQRPDLLPAIESEYGIKDGKWARADEERFATDLERYVGHGESPAKSPEIEQIFARAQSFIQDVYGVAQGPLSSRIGQAARGVFNSVFGFDHPTEDPLVTAGKIKATIEDALKTGTPFDKALADSAYAHINWDHVGSGDEVKSVLQTLELTTEQRMQSETGEVHTLASVRQKAIDLSADPTNLIKWAELNEPTIRDLDAKLTALRGVRDAAAMRIIEKSRQYTDRGPESPGTAVDLSNAFKAAEKVDFLVGSHSRAIARALGSMRISSEVTASALKGLDFVQAHAKEVSTAEAAASAAGVEIQPRSVLDTLKDPVKGPELAQSLQFAGSLQDPGAVPKVLRYINKTGQSGLDLYIKYYRAALLSGPKTFTATLLSNVMNAVVKPTNWAIGGVWDGAVHGDWSVSRDAISTMYHMTHAAIDFMSMVKGDLDRPSSLAAGWKAFVDSRPILDGSNDPTGTTTDNNLPWMIGGQVLGLGIKTHQGTFEYMKQLAYRARVMTDTMSVLQKADPNAVASMTSVQRKAVMNAALTQSLNPDGSAATDPDGDLLYPRALRYAEEQTQTQPLRPGTIGASLQKITKDVPVLQAIFPMVRVPTNLVRSGIQQTGLPGLIQQEFREQLRSPDANIRAEARGKLATGTALSVYLTSLALSGKLTGGGPKDQARKQALLATGWIPYSYKTDAGQYISLHRLEPLASVAGLIADYAENSGYMNENQRSSVGTAIVTALARNLGDKTYFQGITETSKLLSGDETSIEQIARSFAASNVPNAIRSVNSSFDESLREPKSVLEAVMASIPMLDENVSPKRDLFGQRVMPVPGYVPFFDTQDRSIPANLARTLSPLATNTDVGDDVKTEIAKLNFGFQRPPQSLGGMDLRSFKNSDGQSAHDRLLELVGEVKLNGKTIDQKMDSLISSSQYRHLASPNGVNDQVNPRVMAVNSVLAQYHEAAQYHMMKEFPEIRRMLKDSLKSERSGNPAGSDVLPHLINAH